MNRITYTSLTRIADLADSPMEFQQLDRSEWREADYVLCKVINPGNGQLKIELPSGRMAPIMADDHLIGALGTRYATLEATGGWRDVGEDLQMHLLTGAGLLGKLTSASIFIPPLIQIQYLGHVYSHGKRKNMADYLPNPPSAVFNIPVVMLVGTSMSSGKTTSARVATHILKEGGLKVVSAKLTGAGRYRDILAVSDAGADEIYDFVDVGLPSTVVAPALYKERLEILLHLIQGSGADVAVIEIGASPLEPYNGDVAFRRIGDQIKCTILCASDPYAVLGVMQSFGITPDIVSGPATNTLGGIDLIKNLCQVKALNLIDPSTKAKVRQVLIEKLGLASWK